VAYRVAVEDIEPNHWIAWGLDLPGCFSSAKSQEEAVALAPTEISRYFAWLRNYGYRELPKHGSIQVEVVESFNSFVSEGMYIVNAFFEDDLRPLEPKEVEFCLWLLDRTREDLITRVEQIPQEKRNHTIPGEVQGSILGILEHIAWSEWWYFERLDKAISRENIPSDPFAMLETVRDQTKRVLPDLIGWESVVEKENERWSARKSLRRTLWHERDHTHHITKLGSYI
jgi:hypothetical protein